MTDESTTVTYTVKELLSRIDHKIDQLARSLDHKASQSSVDSLASRIDALERGFSKMDEDVGSLKNARVQLLTVVALLSFAIPLLVALIIHYI